MGKNTKTTNFLKECMADALIRQMKVKPFAKITINEIAEIAGVNRSTWFRNFQTKEEALTFKLIQLWDHFAQKHGIEEAQKYDFETARAFFQFNYEIRDLLQQINATGISASIYNAFYEIMMSECAGTTAQRYEVRFYSYGIFGLLNEWIARDFKEKPEVMTHLFLQIIHSSN